MRIVSKKRVIQTKASEIVEYWTKAAVQPTINVLWENAKTHCWRCSCRRNLQRCHIVPDSLNGEDTPSNFVLLCQECHAEGPNVADPDIMWAWIAAYDAPVDGSFWILRGLEEYQRIYHHSFERDVNDVLFRANAPELTTEEIKERYFKAMEQSSVHFAQSYPNAATIAGTLRIFLKAVASEQGVGLLSTEACTGG